MNAEQTLNTTRRRSGWVDRLTLPVAVGLLWAALHYAVNGTVLTRGLDQPVLVLVGGGGFASAGVVLALLLVAAFLGESLCGKRDGTAGLLVVALGVALWAWSGGTMDDWLIARNPVAGPASGAAYRPLIAEYAFWAVAAAAIMALSAWRNRTAETPNLSDSWRRIYGPDVKPGATRGGVTALIVTVVVAAVLLMILSGPRVSHTQRGQVFFSVAAAFALATFAGERITKVHAPIWYLPAPLIVGVVGVLAAISHPDLPGVYQNINVIPAGALVRPLPIEMVGVGLAAIILTLRTISRLSSEMDRS